MPPSTRRRVRVPARIALALAAWALTPVAASALTATNGIYTVTGDASSFSAATAASHPLGTGKYLILPYRTDVLVHVYTSSTSYGFGSATVSAIPGGVRRQVTMSSGASLLVQQDTTVTGTTAADSMIRLSVRIENTGMTSVDIGARIAMDVMLASDDGPTFTPEGGTAITAAQRYTEPPFRTFALQDDTFAQPTLRARWSAGATNLGTTPPDVLDVENCCRSSTPPLLPSSLNGSYMSSDSDVRWVWGHDLAHARTIAPGASVTFAIASVLAAPGSLPANSLLPTIAGTPEQAATITGALGTWNGSPLTTYAGQWLRCDAGGGACVSISGATTATYTAAADDVGSRLRYRVTADGAVSADSLPTALIEAPASSPTPAPTAPAPIAAPPPPAPVVLLAPDAATTTRSPSITFTGVEGGSFECRLDEAAFAPCLSPATYQRVPVGAHTIDVRQIATDGTVGAAVTVAFTIVEAATDPPRAAPTLAVVLGPSERRADGTAGLDATLLTDGSQAAVGCAVRGQVMRTCVARVYAAGRGTALAAATPSAARRRVLVGVGILKAARGVVDVRLNAVGRRLLVAHGGRLTVTVDIRARTSQGVTLRAVKAARLVMTRVVVVPDLGFRPARAALPRAAKLYLRRLARTIGPARQVRCVGHTDSHGRTGAFEWALGRQRAQAVCAELRRGGVRAGLVVASRGDTQPRASNDSATGRSRNRRVVVTITR